MSAQEQQVQRPDGVIAGQDPKSVLVQSQLQSSTIDGKGITSHNLGQVVNDLGAAHNAHSGWLENETRKINDWGSAEIGRILQQATHVQERLIEEAQDKQKRMEDSYKVELQKLVQQLDAKKAMQLKEIEDVTQRQLQGALNASKKEINDIETDMNKRKMALVAQAQAQTAQDVDRLANLAVGFKLTPSKTRTVIESNTETGTIVAVASGGEIKTGGAAEQSIVKPSIQAAPIPGTLSQDIDVTTGTLNRNSDNKPVGVGAIVGTMTQLNPEQQRQGQLQGQQLGGSSIDGDRKIASSSTDSGIAPKRVDAAYGRRQDELDKMNSKNLVNPSLSKGHVGTDPAYSKIDGTVDSETAKGVTKLNGEPKSTGITGL